MYCSVVTRDSIIMGCHLGQKDIDITSLRYTSSKIGDWISISELRYLLLINVSIHNYLKRCTLAVFCTSVSFWDNFNVNYSIGQQNIGCHQTMTVIMHAPHHTASHHAASQNFEVGPPQGEMLPLPFPAQMHPDVTGSESPDEQFPVPDNSLAIVGHQYPYRGRGVTIMAYSIISSFIFVTCFCWWSLAFTYTAIALGVSVSYLKCDIDYTSVIIQ